MKGGIDLLCHNNYNIGDLLSGSIPGLPEEERRLLCAAVSSYKADAEARIADYLAATKDMSRKEFMIWSEENVPYMIRGAVRAAWLGQAYDVLVQQYQKDGKAVYKHISQIGIEVQVPPHSERNPKVKQDQLRLWENAAKESGKYRMIDTHAHYNIDHFNWCRIELLNILHELGNIDQIVIPATNFKSIFSAIEMFDAPDYEYIHYAFGIHPKYAWREPEWNSARSADFSDLLNHPKCVAIGETGLDYSYPQFCPRHQQLQEEYFRYFISTANEHNLPLVLHIRSAAGSDSAVKDSLHVLEEEPIRTAAVCHCFGGNENEMNAYLRQNVRFFGIGGRITYDSDIELKRAVSVMPDESILLETDAPYIRLEDGVPGPNTSLSIIKIAEAIARIRGTTAENIIELANRNACDFYRF